MQTKRLLLTPTVGYDSLTSGIAFFAEQATAIQTKLIIGTPSND